ncbi:MAG: SCP2 sterol-binding domain-containing protein [Rhodobacterales bacterium]|nr:SCP2 sterol-binding domain-containing protein [Rhodobacterales bacterium]
MSEIVAAAVAALQDRLSGGFDGVARFVIEGEGSVIIDRDGVRAGEEEADVTLTASVETFRAILDGELNPTTAFMQGRLAVDGSMGLAMKLGSVLS